LERNRSAALRAGLRRKEGGFLGDLFTALKGRSSTKNRPKMLPRLDTDQKQENNRCSRLRNLGCPDTLIKDVRDVAAAVLCSEGPGRSGEKKLNRPGFQAI
jgi:hypothetical protein